MLQTILLAVGKACCSPAGGEKQAKCILQAEEYLQPKCDIINVYIVGLGLPLR